MELESLGWSLKDLPRSCAVLFKVNEAFLMWDGQTQAYLEIFNRWCAREPLSFLDFEHHPDVWCREGQKLTKTDIQELLQLLWVPPLMAQRRFALLDVDVLSAAALQGLLKTVEEPPVASLLLLKTQNPESLPSTLRSRCLKTRLEIEKRLWNKSEEEFQTQFRPFLQARLRQKWSSAQAALWTLDGDQGLLPQRTFWKNWSQLNWPQVISVRWIWKLLEELAPSGDPQQVEWVRSELLWWEKQKDFHLDWQLFLMRLVYV